MEWISCHHILIKKEWLDRPIFNNLEIGRFKFKEHIDTNLEKNVENWFESVKSFDLYTVLFFFLKVILWSIFVRNLDFACFHFVKKLLFYSIINLHEIEFLRPNRPAVNRYVSWSNILFLDVFYQNGNI